MPLFKVCDVSRSAGGRKLIKAENLEELLNKANIKLGITSCKVVTEQEGCEVEEDVLLDVSDQLLMLLEEDQTWMPPQSDQGTGKEQRESSLETVSIAEEPLTPTPSGSSSNSSCMQDEQSGAEGKLKRIYTVPIPPCFSNYVEDKLANNQFEDVLKEMVSELAYFYLTKFPGEDILNTATAYNDMVDQLAKKYPNVSCSIPNVDPWQILKKKLGKKVRNSRFLAKQKSMPEKRHGPVKRPRFAPSDEEATASLRKLSPEEMEKCEEAIKEEWRKPSPDLAHVTMLQRETFLNRREWLTKQPAGRIKPLVERFPFLGDMDYILREFCLLRSIKEDLKQEQRNMKILFKSGLNLMPRKPSGLKAEQDLAVAQFLERASAYDKGKGAKTKTVFTVEKNSETTTESLLTSKRGDAPRLLLFVSTDDELDEAIIIGDEITICTSAKSVPQALMYLSIAYYVWDLEYPRVYSQLLNLVQQTVIKDPIQSTNMSTKLSKILLQVDKFFVQHNKQQEQDN